MDDLTRQIDMRFEAVDRRFEAVDRRFDEMDRRFDRMDRDIRDLRGDVNGLRTLTMRFGSGMIVGLAGVIAAVAANGTGG